MEFEPMTSGAVLDYQLSYQANWELVILWVYNKPIDGEDTVKWIYERSYFNCEER